MAFYLPTPIEGNSSNIVEVLERKSQGYNYNILKYDWELLDGDNQHAEDREHYSLLTNEGQTKVFAYMPPRQTMNYATFRYRDYYCGKDKHEPDTVEVMETIEGTMITFFWNDEIEKWDICTRNGVGCNYSFMHTTFNMDYDKPRTFREMVLDVFRVRQYKSGVESESESMKPINDLSDVDELNSLLKTNCYTCILQHHLNHIVYSRASFKPYLILVAIHEMSSMPPLVPRNSDIQYQDCVRELSNPNRLQLYLRRDDEDDEEGGNELVDHDERVWNYSLKVFDRTTASRRTLLEFLQSTEELDSFKTSLYSDYAEYVKNETAIKALDLVEEESSKFYPPAWTLTNTRTGQKCEIVNPFYEKAKSLRNMQPNLRYLYHSLRKNNAVNEYLNAFPRYVEEFCKLEMEYDYFIKKVHCAYIEFYVLKNRRETNRIPKHYFVHAARIHHNIYLAQNEDGTTPEKRKIITKETVKTYFEQFTPSKIFYFITNKDE
jgi:hypothetical protein